jgi:hypothetical protein
MIDCFVRVGCGAYKALAVPVLMLKPPAGPLADRINDILRAKNYSTWMECDSGFKVKFLQLDRVLTRRDTIKKSPSWRLMRLDQLG